MTKRKDERSKRQKLDEIMLALRDHHEGLTQSELARVVDIGRSDVNKYLKNGDLPSVYEEDGRLFLDRLGDLVRMSFDRDEITMMHVAMRLLSRHTNAHNPHAASALRKLSDVVKRLDPDVSRSLQRTAGQADDPASPHNEELLNTLRVLTEARLRRRKIKVDYELDDGTLTKPYLFSPYFIEPYAPGLTTHVIGYREPPGDIRTFKVERLRNARVDLSDFVLPEDFDPTALLNNAWGIWYTNEPPVEVVLKFAPSVRRRVLETRWHRNQADPEVLADGSVIWRCRIAEPREMLPWVRGWGASVEVLAPAELLAEVRRNVREMMKVYQLAEPKEMPKHWRLWAKADKRTNELHRLIYHMTDVGMVAHVLWEQVLGADLKMRIATWLKLDEARAGKLIAFWSGLHDLGKASPAFQDHQNVTQALRTKIHAELAKAGLAVKDRGKVDHARHEVISTWSLDKEGWLVSCAHLNGELAKRVAQMLGGHHGAWPDSTLFLPDRLKTDDKGDESWRDVRKAMLMAMADTFQPPSLPDFEPNTTEDNVMLSLISGIVSLADWLGSDEENFAYEEEFVELDEYAKRAHQLAEQALTRAEWESAPLAATFDFQTAFNFSPNEAQSGIKSSLQNAVLPSLAIIESPMGSGKTEAALATYAVWAQKLGQARLYVAMPTTATSNQMWERVNKFLGKQYGASAQPMLVHSQALLRQTDHLPESEDLLEEKDKIQNGDRVASQTWFLPRKRSLLVPFGVGTVDQALMSVLQTKHFFVRLLGLAGKVVIFDEVHAYDAYMNTLFCRLLQWLRQVGASVIVLSATLPQKARRQLLAAWGATEVPDAQYPRLTWANSDSSHAQVLELQPPSKRTLDYGWIGRDTDAILQKLKDELRSGGCAAVICNTVTRAQQVYEAINNDAFLQTIDADNRILFHARFPLAWREGIEQNVLAKFGPNINKQDKQPNPNRPKTAIVVATQVLEQSLDLDFDVMISDHAPVDLLLQRAGRLHRHAANAAMRKHADVLWIAGPEAKDGMPTFARGDTYVYDEYVLLRSWLALKLRTPQQVVLPEGVSALIEQVYGEQSMGELPAEIVARLAKTKQEKEKEERSNIHNAKTRLVDAPHDEDLLWGINEELEEDNPTVHQAFQALTREDRPGIQVICLHRVDGALMSEPDRSGHTYDPHIKIDKAMAQELARHSIAIRRPDLEKVLLEPSDPQIQKVLSAWRKNPVLRYQRVAIFVDGECALDDTGFILKLTREYGLQIHKNA